MLGRTVVDGSHGGLVESTVEGQLQRVIWLFIKPHWQELYAGRLQGTKRVGLVRSLTASRQLKLM